MNMWFGSGGSAKPPSSDVPTSAARDSVSKGSSSQATPPMSQCAASAGVSSSSHLRAAGPSSGFRFAARSVRSEHVVAHGRVLERLREEALEVEDFDAALGERVGERVVLLARPLDPEDVVEEKLVLVSRREAPQLEVGTVEDDPPERPDLGADVEARGLLRRRR